MQLLIAFPPGCSNFPWKKTKFRFRFLALTPSNWNLHLRKTLRKVEIEELSSLLSLLERIYISPLCLVVDFGHGLHQVCSLFRLIIWPYSPPSPDFFPYKLIWLHSAPSNYQGFLWKVAWRKAYTNDGSRSVILTSASSLKCVMCLSGPEIKDHLFIHYPFIWNSGENFATWSISSWLILTHPLIIFANGGPHIGRWAKE